MKLRTLVLQAVGVCGGAAFMGYGLAGVANGAPGRWVFIAVGLLVVALTAWFFG